MDIKALLNMALDQLHEAPKENLTHYQWYARRPCQPSQQDRYIDTCEQTDCFVFVILRANQYFWVIKCQSHISKRIVEIIFNLARKIRGTYLSQGYLF